MPNVLAEQITRQLAVCRTEDEMHECLDLVVEAARSAGFEGEIAELYRQVRDELERQLQHPGDPDRERRLRLARDLARRLAAVSRSAPLSSLWSARTVPERASQEKTETSNV